MVEVHCLDESSVTFPDGTVTGPFTVRAKQAVVGSESYSSGVLLVKSGDAKHVLKMSPVHAEAWPYAVLFFVILGVLVAQRS